jgi:predicted nucleic acid-binding protein
VPGFLLDTNVISELVRQQPDPRVIRWMTARSAIELYLSAITLAEIVRGIERLPGSKRRDVLVRWCRDDIFKQFDDRILAFDREVALIWGRLMASGDRSGRPYSAIDAQIAAISLRHDLTLATRNTSDFAKLGVALVDPWRS